MTIFNTLKSRAFKFCFFGTMAVTAFILGKQIVAQGYGEIMLGHDILIGVIALLFFTAIGERNSSDKTAKRSCSGIGIAKACRRSPPICVYGLKKLDFFVMI